MCSNRLSAQGNIFFFPLSIFFSWIVKDSMCKFFVLLVKCSFFKKKLSVKVSVVLSTFYFQLSLLPYVNPPFVLYSLVFCPSESYCLDLLSNDDPIFSLKHEVY